MLFLLLLWHWITDSVLILCPIIYTGYHRRKIIFSEFIYLLILIKIWNGLINIGICNGKINTFRLPPSSYWNQMIWESLFFEYSRSLVHFRKTFMWKVFILKVCVPKFKSSTWIWKIVYIHSGQQKSSYSNIFWQKKSPHA